MDVKDQMVCRTHIPRPPLSNFAEVFWQYDGLDPSHARERCLPTGTMEIVVNLRDDETRSYDRRSAYQPRKLRGPLVFFGVADLEAAMVRVRELGGHAETLESRADVPQEGTFGRFALCRDDQSSPLGLHQRPAADGKGTREPATRRPTIEYITLRVRNLPASRRF
jgi:hypothetical protein